MTEGKGSLLAPLGGSLSRHDGVRRICWFAVVLGLRDVIGSAAT